MTSTGWIPVLPETWTHLALVGDTTEIRFYQNGMLVHWNAVPFNSFRELAADSGMFRIGRGLEGDVDWVRISKTARYKDDFTPVLTRESDEHTLGLYLFEEGQGKRIRDSSGNNHSGTVIHPELTQWGNTAE